VNFSPSVFLLNYHTERFDIAFHETYSFLIIKDVLVKVVVNRFARYIGDYSFGANVSLNDDKIVNIDRGLDGEVG